MITASFSFFGRFRLWGTLAIVIAVALASAGCDNDDPTGPTTPTQSTVNLILNGADYSNTPVNLNDNVSGIWMKTSDSTFLATLDALATFGGSLTRRVACTVTLPAGRPGTYPWIDPQGAVLSASGVFLDIYSQDQTRQSLQPVQGTTTVSTVGAVSGQVTATFSGTMRITSTGQIVTLSNGNFSLTRLTDK